MGIQINGQTDSISATDGSLTVSGADFTGVSAGTTAAPSISPTGDSNTGIFFPSADTVAIAEGGVEAFRITSTGQLQAIGAADVRLTLGSGGTAGTNDSVHIRADGANLKFMNASGGATIFEQNGTERLRIDSSGRVTTPYQTAFHAYNNATQNLGTSGTVKILAQVADVNRGSVWNTSTSRFTAPVSGVYCLSSTITFEYNGGSPGTDDTSFVGLYKNGSGYNFSSGNAINPRNRFGVNPQYFSRDGVEFTQSGNWLIQLSQNDYIEFYILDVNTNGARIESCLLNGYLIG